MGHGRVLIKRPAATAYKKASCGGYCGDYRDPQGLAERLGRHLESARIDRHSWRGDPRGVLAPHVKPRGDGARVQAHAYSVIRDIRPDKVVVVSMNHNEKAEPRQEGIHAPNFTHYRMPLADLRVNFDLLDAVCGIPAHNSVDMFEGQNSMEVQLLWLSAISRALDYEIEIAPIILDYFENHHINWQRSAMVGERVARLGDDFGRIMLIATADLCHGHNKDITQRVDQRTIAQIGLLNREGMLKYFWDTVYYGRTEFVEDIRQPCCSGNAIAAFLGLGDGLERAKVVELARGSTHDYIQSDVSDNVGFASLAVLDNF
ncbi:MAG: AmmeMemoRadiSam system protein B [Candidatus Margulisbacteria bacterium]|nr:AmmeMemoRadiSam system protein B [Candidatus Margulisiibacteriota bacterium]MBU1021199.1 AmmeMemoRadiSam system protein B [Candidatus Margulisiibacteriota bacterium]MBU1729805.1 AmmeMemoRadiSam system protein B [Candidatus Margulisiibacteriota bacterium]MBU1955306.1 AmmeMemoRadiSam system protein B [Candidatus Margulisiibacteriota bacterium]